MKKRTVIVLIILLVAAIAAGGGVLGWKLHYQNTHVFVEGTAYEKDLTQLDLRGTGVSMDYYEQVRQALPDCQIRYDLPFQGGFYSDDTQELTITTLTDGEIAQLDYLPELKTVHAEACTDYPQLLALAQRRPECQVLYQVSIFGKDYPQDTKELSFGSEKLDLSQLTEALAWLPKMETITFDQPTNPAQELIDLKNAFPQVDIRWEKDAFGKTYASDVTEIDLTDLRIETLEPVEEAMAYYPALEKVILSNAGPDERHPIDNETMAAFREKMRPSYKVVWTVQINYLKVRTDETYFMPAKQHAVVTNFQVQNLKYCEDMVCVDLGHMAIQDISFVEYMPHLKYFIVIDAPLMYIDSISTCKELIYLEFFWTWINDYTPLLGCTALEDLNVARTNGDIMTFKDMPWLKNLWVDGWRIKESDKQILNEALPDTFIKYCDGEMTANGWRDLPNYFAMRDYLGMPYNRW